VGLFDKRIKKDDFEPPVEEVSLHPPTGGAGMGGGDSASRERARAAASLELEAPDYGIDKAIELMRQLPQDNVELVVRVVKTTLHSLRIDVSSIIKDATRKQNEVQARISVLRKEIADLESEIGTRRGEIATLDADYKETTMVKDRLSLAERSTVSEPTIKTMTVGAPAPIGPAPIGPKPPTLPPGSSGTPTFPASGSDSGSIKK